MKHFKFWLPVLFWASFMFFLSHVPDLKSGFTHDFMIRKIAHVAEYFILSLLLYRALRRSLRLRGFNLSFYLGGLGIVYALSDEIHQLFVRGRHGNLTDVCIDTLGILFFCLAIRFYGVWLRSHRHRFLRSLIGWVTPSYWTRGDKEDSF